MLKMKNFIMIMMIVLITCLLFTMSLEVNATGLGDDPITLNGFDIVIGEDDTNAITANEIAANEMAANETAANSQAPILQPETNTSVNATGNTLPQTGVTEDITVMFFIIVCVISAIYAYKKIRDYNI